MFSCERCGSRYSAMHAATLENCPRCQIRDRISAPLAFKAFESSDLPKRSALKPRSLPLKASARVGGDRPQPASRPARDSLSQAG